MGKGANNLEGSPPTLNLGGGQDEGSEARQSEPEKEAECHRKKICWGANDEIQSENWKTVPGTVNMEHNYYYGNENWD